MQVNTCPSIPAPYYALRHYSGSGHLPSTFRLECAYWELIDLLAKKKGLTWQQWVTDALSTKPPDVGRASWLRVSCLKGLL